MSRITPWDQAFVIHTRPYRETSLIVQWFTEQHGLISTVAKGARRNNSSWRALLQPFIPCWIQWVGRHELQTLTQAEASGEWWKLTGNYLVSGLYLNELLIRLLPHHDPCPNLFTYYYSALQSLAANAALQPVLRRFEKVLLTELGYGLVLDKEAGVDREIQPQQFYRYVPGHGLQLVVQDENTLHDEILLSGKSLLELQQDELTNPQTLQDAKQLFRSLLMLLLDNKPIRSRELL